MEAIYMSPAEWLKNLRLKHGLTQAELGDRVGMSQQQIAMYETGVRNPKKTTIIRIAEIIGEDAEELPFEIQDMVTTGGRGVKLAEATKELNDSGFNKVMEYIKDISKIPEYRVNNSTS